jgi:hypothetical protein
VTDFASSLHRASTTLVLTIVAAGVGACSGDRGAHPAAASHACAAAEYHEFDFFLGDWDTYDISAPDKAIARNHVTPMVGACAVRELYEQFDGRVGESFSVYDATRQLWHQSWVTNAGELLLLDGHLIGDKMVLIGTQRSANGVPSLVRGVWYRDSTGVRETADRSSDSGRTWSPWFDIEFRRHGRSTSNR